MPTEHTAKSVSPERAENHPPRAERLRARIKYASMNILYSSQPAGDSMHSSPVGASFRQVSAIRML
jgi:hypothetical protein